MSPAPPIKARIARGVSRFPPPRSRLKLGASGSGLAQAPTPRVSLYAPGMQTNEPDLPTVGDFLPGYEASAWYGIAAPKNTSSEIVVKLNMEMNAGLADAGVRARLADLGGTVTPGSPADFGKLVAEEIEKWGKVVKFSGAKPE